MKRNRSRYIVYFEPWEPGKHKVCRSKWQAKKALLKAEDGSYFDKYRLIWRKDGSCSFWKLDKDYDRWTVGRNQQTKRC